MDSAKLRILADQTAAAIVSHVERKLGPVLARQESADQIAADAGERIAKLERRLRELEARLASRRAA